MVRIKNSDLSVMTFNIRNSMDDRSTVHDWDNRADLVTQLVKRSNPDIIGFQEVYKDQLDTLNEQLPEYDFVGLARDDGVAKGEFNPIFYKQGFSVKNTATFWLSDSPEICSNTWGGLNRICTYINFKNGFCFYNTHLEYLSAGIRIKSIELIKKKIQENSSGLAAILVGDFNFNRWSREYSILLDDFVDAYRVCKKYWIFDINVTYHGFKGKKGMVRHWPSRKIIDYIWFKGNLKVKSAKILTSNVSELQTYASDHWPLMVEFKLE